MKTSHSRKAFTIVELVIVIAVIAILAAVLIPTFSGIVKKAHVSNDTTAARNLSMQLSVYSVDGKIKNESDLRDAINELMGSGYYEGNLIPQSANQGYHFWYDIQQGTVVVQTAADIVALAAERAVNPTVSADNVRMSDEPAVILNEESDPWSKHFRYYNGFLMIDRGGSPVAAALVLADKLGTESYVHSTITAALSAITTGPDKDFAASALEKLRKTAIVAYGTFVEDAAAAIESVYVSLTAPAITDTNTVINNQSAIDVVIPSNIGTVDSYSMQFNADVNLHIDTTEDELSNIFAEESVSSTGGTVNIVLPEGNYTINGNEIIREDGTTFDTGDISSSSVVTDLTLSELRTNKLYLTVNPENPSAYDLYVAVDYTGTISLGVDKYFGNDAQGNKKEIIARGTQWEVANGNISYENGAFTVGGFANDDAAKAGTITAKIQDVTKTINVYGVKALNVKVDTSSNVGLNIRDIDQHNVTITLPYTEGDINTWSFEPSVVLNHKNTSVIPAGSIKVSESSNTLTYTDNVLYLKSGYTDNAIKNITVSFVDAEGNDIIDNSINYKVSLINQGKAAFAKDNHLSTYFKDTTYYVGNSGPFKLEYLFDSIAGKDSTDQVVCLSVHRGQTKIGENVNAAGLNYAFDPSKLETIDADYVFTLSVGEEYLVNDNGTPDDPSDDILKIQEVSASTSVTVRLVAATNVTEDTTEIPSGNVVLLSDITISASNVSGYDTKNSSKLSFNNVYGNLHTIDATGFTSPESSTYMSQLITLNGTMDNTILKGPVYPKVAVGVNGGKYCWDGVRLNGSLAKITNSYLSGFRAPVNVVDAGAAVTISDTTIEGGTYCNLFLHQMTSLTLHNVVTIQNDAGYTASDGDAVLGLGIFVDSPNVGTIIFSGSTYQYNWIERSKLSGFQDLGLDFNAGAVFAQAVEKVQEQFIHYTECTLDHACGGCDGECNSEEYYNTAIAQQTSDSFYVSDISVQYSDSFVGTRYEKTTISGTILVVKYSYSMWTFECNEGASSCTTCSRPSLPHGHTGSYGVSAYLSDRAPGENNTPAKIPYAAY